MSRLCAEKSKTKITVPSVTKTAPVKEKGESNWLDEMSNLLPVIGGLFDKYDWHTESSQITPPRFVPVNADPRSLLRAADESLAMARYNQANISPTDIKNLMIPLPDIKTQRKTPLWKKTLQKCSYQREYRKVYS